MLACFALGAEGVQMGTRFVASEESSGHSAFKQALIGSHEGDTQLMLKQLTPVRLLRNRFSEAVAAAEARGASADELRELLGRARAKKGMFEGDLEEGELEIGQVAAAVREIRPAGAIVQEVWQEFLQARQRIADLEV
jgi:enoyl-[acyl-carrier protein] reductase II